MFLAALEQGKRPYDKILDAPIEDGTYRPENFRDEYLGEVTLNTALARSLNTAAVRLADDTGIGPVITLARKMGIESTLPRDLSLALGSGGVPLLEMVTAYAVIANEGAAVNPYAITAIRDDNGTLLYMRTDAGTRSQTVNRRAARILTGMMREVIDTGTGQAARLPFEAAGKTGTSQDYRDALFIGFTDRYIAGVWLGNDDNSPMDGITGGSVPAQIWHDILSAAHEKRGADAPPLHTSPGLAADPPEGGFLSLLQRLLSPSSPSEP